MLSAKVQALAHQRICAFRRPDATIAFCRHPQGMAKAETRHGASQRGGQEGASHCTCRQRKFCTSEVSQQLKRALPGPLPAHRACVHEPSPACAAPAAQGRGAQPSLPRLEGLSTCHEHQLPSSQGRNSTRLSLGVAWFFCCGFFFLSFFLFYVRLTVSCRLQVKIIN